MPTDFIALSRRAVIVLACLTPFHGATMTSAQTPATTAPVALNPRATVSHQGDRVTIENVPTLGWMTNGRTTYCGALSAALSVTDRPFAYATLMGDSGLAFRLRWWVANDGKGWDMSSPVGEFPDWTKAAEKSVGWDVRWETHFGGDPPMAAFKPDVVRSIDAGLPVLVYGKTWDLGLVYGYESAGDVLLVRDYFEGARETKVATKDVKSLLAFFGAKREPLPRRDAILAGLTAAVRDWRRPVEPMDAGRFGPGGYRFGNDAYGTWVENLKGAAELPDDRRRSLFDASWWTLCVLVDARHTAAKYLRDSAKDFDGKVEAELLAAADCCERSANVAWQPTFEDKMVFLGPWSGKGFGDWTPTARQREVLMLSEMRELDGKAIDHVEEALQEAMNEKLE